MEKVNIFISCGLFYEDSLGLFNITRCPAPCSYKEYRLIEKEMLSVRSPKYKRTVLVSFIAVTSATTVQSEQLLYPPMLLISGEANC